MTYKIPQYQPQFVYDKDSYEELEKQLDELNAELNVREIEVTFTGERLFFGNVTSSHDAFNLFVTPFSKASKYRSILWLCI